VKFVSVLVMKNLFTENLSLGGSMKYEEVKKKGKTHMKFVSTKGLVKPSSNSFSF
jgi:hypothetical protein